MRYSDFKIANEGLVDSAVGAAAAVGVFALPFVILGVPMHFMKKKCNKLRKDELVKYFESRGLSSDPKEIEKYIATTRDKILHRCLEYAKKIESSSKFKAEAEKRIKTSMDKYQKEFEDESKDGTTDKTWAKYHPNEVTFAPFVTDGFDAEKAVVLVAKDCKLEKRIYAEEDGDDNAPYYYTSILNPIVQPVAEAVITKIQKDFSEDFAAGIVTIKYFESDIYDLPCIGVTGEEVPKIKGWNK